MRTTPAILILTLAASTASIAAPVVGLPGGASAHAVEPKIVEIALAPAEFIGATLPADVTGVRQRLLSPANFTAAFSMIGLTWDGPVQPVERGFDLSVRTRHGGAWTAWSALEADGDGPDGNADAAELAADPQAVAIEQRPGTAPLWVGDSDAFQVRVDRLRAAPRSELPTGLRALLVDPGRSAADAAVGSVPRVASQAHATIAWPTVYRRKDWGADEHLRDSSPRYTGPIQAAFVHHTAGTNDYSPADVPKILRGVYAYHVRGRGWSDVGYNFLVDRFGRIWEGRAGGIDRTVLGAHTGGFNSDSFGVSVMGDYTKAQPSAETVAAIARVIAWKFSLAGDGPSLDPLSIVELVSAGGGTSRYKAGTAHDFVRISGHTDAGNTECPGKYLYAQLPAIRSMVRHMLDEDSTYGPALPAGAPAGTSDPAPARDTGAATPGPEEGGDDVTRAGGG
ncbi:MAG TPA: N-acetylmuramoyl-L-alanine amidase [Sporichthya sp.]|nr:N-acetylmuramoyl-L-alanine amidase [Sporichthya sp.]